MKAIVKTRIDGIDYQFKGKLSKCGKVLHCKDKMFLTISESDKVEILETVKREQKINAYLDMAKWFKLSKQI
jgi:hypothetical protein